MMVNKFAVIFSCTVYISVVRCIQFVENTEENYKTEYNTTTLYPVDKLPFVKATTERNAVKISEKDLNVDRTTWTINTSFAVPKLEYEDKTHLPVKTIDINHNDGKGLKIMHIQDDNKDVKTSLELPKGNSNEDETGPKKEEVTKRYNKNEEDRRLWKQFKPSPHLNSYYDTLDDSPLNKFTTSAPTQETPSFFGSPRDQFEPQHKQEGYVAFPYKYETYSAIDNSWGGHSLQSKPTLEAPVSIPAGGLYKNHNVLREKPNFYEENDFHQDSVDNVKESSVKKRPNPWKSLLHLVTALLPIGLIVSALTPSIVTIEDPSNTQQYNRASRRLGESKQSPGLPVLPAVSEDCKLRLLCEIHSDRYYDNPHGRRRAKHCHKLRCEEPRALNDLLHWLLTYHRTINTRDGGYI